eukprot:g8927.t1
MVRLFRRKKRSLAVQASAAAAGKDAPKQEQQQPQQDAEQAPKQQQPQQQRQHQQPHQVLEEQDDKGLEAREERQHTIDLQRSSRGMSNSELLTILHHRDLRMERQLSLPDHHPRSSSNDYGQTDREDSESEETGERSDRSVSIDVRRTDAAHFAVGSSPSEDRGQKGTPRKQSFLFTQSLRRS